MGNLFQTNAEDDLIAWITIFFLLKGKVYRIFKVTRHLYRNNVSFYLPILTQLKYRDVKLRDLSSLLNEDKVFSWSCYLSVNIKAIKLLLNAVFHRYYKV